MKLTLSFLFWTLLACEVVHGATLARVNSCSGGLFTVTGQNAQDKALVITNGHCIRLADISGAPSNYPAPGQVIHDLKGSRLTQGTGIVLHTDQGSYPVPVHRLIFATMTGTDVAIYELEKSYVELKTLYRAEPFTLDFVGLRFFDTISVRSGYYGKAEICHIEDIVDLAEGPYRTSKALKFSLGCRIYNGFSGSLVVKANGKEFFGLANTHFSEDSANAPCDLNKPCEVNPATGERTQGASGQSYGVNLRFLKQCWSALKHQFDFLGPDCAYPDLRNQEN